MENLTGRNYRVGKNGECFYHEPAGTKFIVADCHKAVVGTFGSRNEAVDRMIDKGIETGLRHSVLAEEPNNNELILLETF